MNRWNCRICRTWGVGGPNGWTRHAKAAHDRSSTFASVSMARQSDYGDGWRTSHWADYRGPVRLSFGFVPRDGEQA